MIKVQSTAEEASGLKSISQEEYLVDHTQVVQVVSKWRQVVQVVSKWRQVVQVVSKWRQVVSSGFQVAPSGLKKPFSYSAIDFACYEKV